MTMNDQVIKEILIEQNQSFKDLDLKHQEFDQRLTELNNRGIKSDNDLVELQELKKHKLRIKDSMQRFIHEYRKNNTQ